MTDLEKGTEGKETVAHEDDGQDEREGAAREQAPSEKSRSKAPWLMGALGLGIAAGLGIGWLSHDFQVNKAQKEADAAVKGRGDEATGPCKNWADTICERMGELAYECTHARAASALLSGSACVQAQESALAKIDALKAERVQCDELTSKLCADLGPEGKGCELAMAKAPTFSIEDCQDMTKRYQRVLAQIMERQEKGTLPKPPGTPRNVAITKPN